MRESDPVSDQWVSKGVYQDSSTENYKLPYPNGLEQNWELICSCNKTFRNIGFRQNCFQIPKWRNLDSVSLVLPVQPSRLLAEFLENIPHCGLKATTAAPALTPSFVEAQLNNKKLLASIPRKKNPLYLFFFLIKQKSYFIINRFLLKFGWRTNKRQTLHVQWNSSHDSQNFLTLDGNIVLY